MVSRTTLAVIVGVIVAVMVVGIASYLYYLHTIKPTTVTPKGYAYGKKATTTTTAVATTGKGKQVRARKGRTTAIAATTTPKFSKYAVYLYLSEMTGLDPSTEFSNSIVVLNLMYDTLTRYDPTTGKVLPWLAVSWEVKDHGLTWIFHLRKGVKFHDGTPLTARAVKLSIERTIRLGQGPAFIWDPVKSIETPDNYTVVFHLKYPAPLDIIAASAYGAFIINPKYINLSPKEFTEKAIDAGSGPYMLVKWQPNKEIVLKAFKDYWAGFRPGAPEEVIIRIVPDAKTEELMVLNGEADIARSVPPEDVPSLMKNPKVKVYEFRSFEIMYLMLNTKKPPLNNPLVRKAIAYAIPYDKLVKEAAMGLAERSWAYVPPGMIGYAKVFTYEYNLTKAKELLAKAGYPHGGFKLLLTYTAGDPYERRAAEIIRDSLAKLGIKVEIRALPWEQQWALARSPPEKAQDMLIFYWWPTLISPYDFLKNMFHTENKTFFNLCYYSNPEFDKLIDEAWRLEGTNRAKAAEMYIEAQKILARDVPAIPLMLMKTVFLTNARTVKYFTYNPAYPEVIFFNQISLSR